MEINTVDDYLNQYKDDVKQKLIFIRKAIKEAAPEAEERISWGLPTYYQEGYLVQFRKNKDSIGFYTCPETIEQFKEQLKGYKTNNKNTTQLSITEPIPVKLIKAMTQFRISLKQKEKKI